MADRMTYRPNSITLSFRGDRVSGAANDPVLAEQARAATEFCAHNGPCGADVNGCIVAARRSPTR